MSPFTAPPMEGFPSNAPSAPSKQLRYVDVGVTATAKEFAGMYRNKQCHPPDFSSTLERAKTKGVERVILTGMSVNDVEYNLAITQSNPGYCFMTACVHPYHAGELRTEHSLQNLSQSINELLNLQPCPLVAFGELGLDLDRTDHASKEVQVEAFKAQLELYLREEWYLPLFLHCRSAFDDFVEILEPYISRMPRKGLVHSFVGTAAQMEKLIDLGLEISINGFSFKTEESQKMVSEIPLDRLHLETDAPWGDIKNSSELIGLCCRNEPPAPPARKKDKWDASSMVKERNA